MKLRGVVCFTDEIVLLTFRCYERQIKAGKIPSLPGAA